MIISEKKTIREIHNLTNQYYQNLIQTSSFWGRLNKVQTLQHQITKKILKARHTSKMRSILNENQNVDGFLITNTDLLRQNSNDISLWLLKTLAIIFTAPFSIPILLLWSRIHRGQFNFFKTDGSILVEKIKNTPYSKLGNQPNSSIINKLRTYSQPLLNIIIWINNMLSIAEWRYRFLPRNQQGSSYHTILYFGEQRHDVENMSSFDSPRPSINSRIAIHSGNDNEQRNQPYLAMATTFFNATTSGFASFSGCFYTTLKLKDKQHLILEEANFKCEAFLEEVLADLDIITEAVSNFNQEQKFLNEQMEISNIKRENLNQSLSDHLVPNETIRTLPDELPMDRRHCIEMLRQHSELINLYPQAPDGVGNSLESIESFYEQMKQHHEKVLHMTESLIPELSCLLKKARINNSEPVTILQR